MSTSVLYVHFQTICHDVSVESGRRACVRKSVYLCTRESADRGLQGEAFMEPALVNGESANFHVFDLAGSIGAVAMIADPTAPSYIRRSWDEARLLLECEHIPTQYAWATRLPRHCELPARQQGGDM